MFPTVALIIRAQRERAKRGNITPRYDLQLTNLINRCKTRDNTLINATMWSLNQTLLLDTFEGNERAMNRFVISKNIAIENTVGNESQNRINITRKITKCTVDIIMNVTMNKDNEYKSESFTIEFSRIFIPQYIP